MGLEKYKVGLFVGNHHLVVKCSTKSLPYLSFDEYFLPYQNHPLAHHLVLNTCKVSKNKLRHLPLNLILTAHPSFEVKKSVNLILERCYMYFRYY